MKINRIKSIIILSNEFVIKYDNTHCGGSFSWVKSEIIIGVKSIKETPLYTYSIISHEIMELILVGMGARFYSGRTGDNYLFNFDHQTFETAIQIHTQAMYEFIK